MRSSTELPAPKKDSTPLSESSGLILKNQNRYIVVIHLVQPNGDQMGLERRVSLWGSMRVILSSHRATGSPGVSAQSTTTAHPLKGATCPPAICSLEHSVIQVLSTQRNRSRSRRAVLGSKQKERGRDFFFFLIYRLLYHL